MSVATDARASSTLTGTSVKQPKRIPSKIKQDTTYYPHQIEGIRWMARRSSFILADSQGLGKTLQVLTVAALDFDLGRASRILVICEASLKYNWAFDEIEDWTYYSYHVLDGDKKQRPAQLQDFAATGTDILIVNYEQVAAHHAELNDIGFDIVMVDECHEIKNWSAAKTKAVHKLRPKRWFLMSGTPLENRPDELWSPLRLVDPNTPKYWTWVHRHCLFGGFGGKQIVGVKKKAELREYLETIMLRRLKRDTLPLPDKQYVKIEVDLSDLQRELYDQILDELQLELPDDPEPMDLESGLTRTMRLRQLCSTPATLGFDDESSKLDAVVDKANDLMAAGHKVVVFTQFIDTHRALQRRIEAAGWPVWGVRGSVKPKDRKLRERAWRHHEGPAVFLATFQTCGRGLTLVEARHVIMADKLYVPGKMEQAEDRLHRIGQSLTEPVQVIEVIARGTYEEKIEKILHDKGAMIDTLIPNSGWRRKLYEAILERGDE